MSSTAMAKQAERIFEALADLELIGNVLEAVRWNVLICGRSDNVLFGEHHDAKVANKPVFVKTGVVPLFYSPQSMGLIPDKSIAHT